METERTLKSKREDTPTQSEKEKGSKSTICSTFPAYSRYLFVSAIEAVISRSKCSKIRLWAWLKGICHVHIVQIRLSRTLVLLGTLFVLSRAPCSPADCRVGLGLR